MQVQLLSKDYLTEEQAAYYLDFEKATLRVWRAKSKKQGRLIGPAWRNVASAVGQRPRIRYHLQDLKAFLDQGVIQLKPEKRRGRPRKEAVSREGGKE